MGYRRTCPECGVIVYSIGAHRGKRPCQATQTFNKMRAQGLCRVTDVLSWRDPVPLVLQHLVHKARSGLQYSELVEEQWLPKWAGAMLLDNHWSSEMVERVESDPDLQVALALEYDLRAPLNPFRR